jgi:hypothetical protein
MEISEILKRLLGDINVYCETNHDDDVMKNLDAYSEALGAVLDRLSRCASWKGDYRGSANACGTKAQSIIVACIMENIDEKTAIELSKAIAETYPQKKETTKEK